MTEETKGNILVVEDLEKFRSVLERMLSRAGYAVDTAKNEDEAYEKLNTNRYHVVTLDMNLTENDNVREGEDVLYYIRQTYPNTMCIVVSASVLEPDEVATFFTEYGIAGFDSKANLRPMTFLPKVEKAVGQAKALQNTEGHYQGPVKIFLSYRRKPSRAFARTLHDQLSPYYPNGEVFYDMEDLGVGEFPRILENQVQSCDVFVPIIGEGTFGERIHEANDWVRHEIRLGLNSGALIIPVLDGKTPVPDRESLPEDIQNLFDHNAIAIYDEYFQAGIDKLAGAIDEFMKARG